MAWCAALVLALHCGLALLPLPPSDGSSGRSADPAAAGGAPSGAGGASLTLVDLQLSRGTSLDPGLDVPTAPTPVEPVPEPVVVPSAAPADAPPVATLAGGEPSGAAAGGQAGAADGSEAGGGAGGSLAGPGAAGGSQLLALRPRVWVHPLVPEKIMRKRKIDDFVLLQVLVGIDGRVRDVRVLRSIANCEECTQSAIEAAQQFRYEPPLVAGRPAEVWTEPFDMRFSYR
jgi:TonB family protein